ncbi:MAG: hypothetical protein HY881_08995 [Deltaproteobacteria bacterium]|nr:hypothetical protein [Deltaproteobacteria bacterium]
MTVSAVSTSTSSANNLYSSGSSTLGKNDFLTLMITQLQNQDPLNPADSTQFVAELAQFTSLEQLTNVNDNLKIVQAFNQSINNAQAVSFVGKTIKASGAMFQISSGETHEVQYQLGEDADKVYVSILDSTGQTVKKIEMDQMTAGQQSVIWDGKDDNGNTVAAGTYSFSVQATDKDGNVMSTAAYVEDIVTGVSYHDSNTYLLSNGIEIPYSAIIEVTEPTN